MIASKTSGQMGLGGQQMWTTENILHFEGTPSPRIVNIRNAKYFAFRTLTRDTHSTSVNEGWGGGVCVYFVIR